MPRWTSGRRWRDAAALGKIGLGGFSVVALEEGIVGPHGMRVDDEVVGGGIAGDDGLLRLGQAAREAGLVAQRADEPRSMVFCARALATAAPTSAWPYQSERRVGWWPRHSMTSKPRCAAATSARISSA